MNHCIFVGNLGQDPEIRTVRGDLKVAEFSVGINERIKKGGEWTDHVEWVQVVAWGRLAELIGEHVRQGTLVTVLGAMRSQKWEGEDGSPQHRTQISASNVMWAKVPTAKPAKPAKPTRKEEEDLY